MEIISTRKKAKRLFSKNIYDKIYVLRCTFDRVFMFYDIKVSSIWPKITAFVWAEVVSLSYIATHVNFIISIIIIIIDSTGGLYRF